MINLKRFILLFSANCRPTKSVHY